MKRAKIILALTGFLLLAFSSLVQSRLVHVAWEPLQNSNIAGFRLYLDNRSVCEANNPNATAMDCTIDVPDGEARFTLTSFSADGLESSPSAPYTYIFSSSLKAVLLADVLTGKSPLLITFNASQSTGNIVQYEWMFGDGENGTGPSVAHTFVNAGTYTVTLKVTDNLGATDRQTATVTVTGPSKEKKPPKAVLSASATVGASPLQVQFDASASLDSDGKIISYKWDMGDGGTATGRKTAYTYNTAGTYTARLTVTDDSGLTDTVSTPVLVSAPPPDGRNKKPVAVISSSGSRGLAPFATLLNGHDSFDPDGKIKSYAWNFGDGSSGSGLAVRHTYALPGRYLITLQVTDEKGAKSDMATLSLAVLDKDSTLLPSLPFILNLLLNGSDRAALNIENKDTMP